MGSRSESPYSHIDRGSSDKMRYYNEGSPPPPVPSVQKTKSAMGSARARPMSVRIKDMALGALKIRGTDSRNESFRFRPKIPEFVKIQSSENDRNAWGAQRQVSTVDIIRSTAGPSGFDFLNDLNILNVHDTSERRSRLASKKFPPAPPKGGVPNLKTLNTKNLKRSHLLASEDVSPHDINNYYFSAVSMDQEQLEAACLSMLLTTVNDKVLNPQVIEEDNGSPSKSRSSARISHRLKQADYLKSSASSVHIRLRTALKDFVSAVSAKYTDTAYHGFHHAVDVTQMMYILMSYYLDDQLNEMEPFILLVSCLCHDIGHLGANNAFLKQDLNSPFVEEFGEESALEKFHVKTALEIIDEQRLFSPDFMSPVVKQKLVDMLTYLVLATDMEKHQHYMDLFIEESKKQDRFRRKSSFGWKIFRTSRSLKDDLGSEKSIPMPFLALTIKLADIANVSRDFNDAKKWAKALSKEFEAMGTLNSKNPEELPEHQKTCSDPDLNDLGKFTLSFMGAFAVPMAQVFASCSKRASWFLLTEMYTNMQMWLTISKDAAEMIHHDSDSESDYEGGD